MYVRQSVSAQMQKWHLKGPVRSSKAPQGLVMLSKAQYGLLSKAQYGLLRPCKALCGPVRPYKSKAQYGLARPTTNAL